MTLQNRVLGFGLFCALGALLPFTSLFGRERRHETQAATRLNLDFVRCHDGDTCTARSPEGIQLTLRLVGIDAPEVAGRARGGKRKGGQSFGNEARDYLVNRVVGKKLPVEIRGSDVYNRYLAVIYDNAGKTRINEELVLKGYAFAYRGKSADSEARAWAEHAEEQARKNKSGFWALPEKERPQDPAIFRRASR